jgi:hypothetical protein
VVGFLDRLKQGPVVDDVIRPTQTVTGTPQPSPEAYGSIARRQRLFYYCQMLLADHPASRDDGGLLGDGTGMEDVVASIEPVFGRERSMIRWTALRGALADLAGCGPVAWEAASESVGLQWLESGPSGSGQWGPAPAHQNLPANLINAAIGVHASIMQRVIRYDEFKGWDLNRVLGDPGVNINQAVGLDYIGWTAVVLNRLDRRGVLPPVTAEPPAPSALEGPGWYVDPIFAKADRYYGGDDWTARCRLPAGHPRRGEEWDQPL